MLGFASHFCDFSISIFLNLISNLFLNFIKQIFVNNYENDEDE